MAYWEAFLAAFFAAFLAIAKPIADLLQAALTCAAILVGFAWVLRKRERFPRATVSQRVQRIALTDAKDLVRVETVVTNLGQVMICLSDCRVRLQQIRPLHPSMLNADGTLNRCTEHEGAWPTIAELRSDFPKDTAQIEPGESQCFESDFLVDSEIEAVQVYCYFANVTKRRGCEIGWNSTTISDFCKQGDEMTERITEQTVIKPHTGTVERQLAPKPATPVVTPPPANPSNVDVQLPPKPVTPVIQPKKSE